MPLKILLFGKTQNMLPTNIALLGKTTDLSAHEKYSFG